MKNYHKIAQHYENCYRKYGDNYRGVDWPIEKDVDTRYRIMLDIIDKSHNGESSLLDFGCGLAHLYDYILRHEMNTIQYSGLDISQEFINVSKKKYPKCQFYRSDILDANDAQNISEFDYVIMNGVFTEKRELPFEEMYSYFKDILRKIFRIAKVGIAFNVMSKHVDWEREDLFHLPFDLLGNFMYKELSRKFIIRNDYGLYEYTVYIYK